MRQDDLDVVGAWTEVKLAILKEYSGAYSKILANQTSIKSYSYIDAFTGAGEHISKKSGETISGSPDIALYIQPPFPHYYFIDLDGKRAKSLKKKYEYREDVIVLMGDCNELLPKAVFPNCRYSNYHRALCLLDPYELNPHWSVVAEAGKMGSIEIFLNFMVMDANMNVLWRNPEKVDHKQAERMTAFWGDESWKQDCYNQVPGLFEPITEKATNKTIVEAYRNRLKDVAGFKYVPEPMPMRNSRGSVIYYLYFASPNATANNIVNDIFQKYRKLGGECG